MLTPTLHGDLVNLEDVNIAQFLARSTQLQGLAVHKLAGMLKSRVQRSFKPSHPTIIFMVGPSPDAFEGLSHAIGTLLVQDKEHWIELLPGQDKQDIRHILDTRIPPAKTHREAHNHHTSAVVVIRDASTAVMCAPELLSGDKHSVWILGCVREQADHVTMVYNSFLEQNSLQSCDTKIQKDECLKLLSTAVGDSAARHMFGDVVDSGFRARAVTGFIPLIPESFQDYVTHTVLPLLTTACAALSESEGIVLQPSTAAAECIASEFKTKTEAASFVEDQLPVIFWEAVQHTVQRLHSRVAGHDFDIADLTVREEKELVSRYLPDIGHTRLVPGGTTQLVRIETEATKPPQLPPAPTTNSPRPQAEVAIPTDTDPGPSATTATSSSSSAAAAEARTSVHPQPLSVPIPSIQNMESPMTSGSERGPGRQSVVQDSNFRNELTAVLDKGKTPPTSAAGSTNTTTTTTTTTTTGTGLPPPPTAAPTPMGEGDGNTTPQVFAAPVPAAASTTDGDTVTASTSDASSSAAPPLPLPLPPPAPVTPDYDPAQDPWESFRIRAETVGDDPPAVESVDVKELLAQPLPPAPAPGSKEAKQQEKEQRKAEKAARKAAERKAKGRSGFSRLFSRSKSVSVPGPMTDLTAAAAAAEQQQGRDGSPTPAVSSPLSLAPPSTFAPSPSDTASPYVGGGSDNLHRASSAPGVRAGSPASVQSNSPAKCTNCTHKVPTNTVSVQTDPDDTLESVMHEFVDVKMKLAEAENELSETGGILRLLMEEKNMLKKQLKKKEAALAELQTSVRTIPYHATPERTAHFVERIHAVQRIQRQWRQVRRWRRFRAIANRITKRVSTRNHKRRELLESERSYVNDISAIVDNYVIPLRQKAIISQQDMQTMFGNLEAIVKINSELLQQLEARFAQFPAVKTVGDIYVAMAPLLRTYIPYVTNFDNIIQTVSQLNQNNKQFEKFQREQKSIPALRGLDLASLLIMPVQRIPRYRLLISALLDSTAQDHPDYGNLVRADQKIQELALEVNKKKGEAENRLALFTEAKLLRVDSKSPDLRKLVNGTLIAPHRQFLRKGPLAVEGNSKPYRCHVFLFNDLLIHAALKQKGTWFRVEHLIDLSRAVLTELESTEEHPFRFEINSAEAYLIFNPTSAGEMKLWVSAIQDACRVLEENRSGFDVALNKV